MTEQKIKLFTQRLQAMQSQADQAMSDYSPGGVRIPANVYIGIQSAELKETKNSGKLMVSRQYTISEGEFKGLNAWDNLVIEDNPTGLQICRRWVEMHGDTWPENDLALLEVIIDKINAQKHTVQLRVKNTTSVNKETGEVREFTNVSVLRLMDLYISTAAKPVAAKPVAAKPVAAKPVAAKPVAAKLAGAQATGAVVRGDIEEMNREQLKKMVSMDPELSKKIRITLRMTDADIRNAINTACGFSSAPVVEETAAPEPEISVEDVVSFCLAQGVEGVHESMCISELIEVMSGYAYRHDELTEPEIAMLVALDLEKNIQRA